MPKKPTQRDILVRAIEIGITQEFNRRHISQYRQYVHIKRDLLTQYVAMAIRHATRELTSPPTKDIEEAIQFQEEYLLEQKRKRNERRNKTQP